MPVENLQLRKAGSRAIGGKDRDQSRRALLLAVVIFSAYALGNILALTYQPLSGWWEVAIHLIHFPFGPELSISLTPIFGFGSIVLGWGAVLIGGLALIASLRNCGYIPSLILAAAPGAGYYLFNIPGPYAGITIPIHDYLVITPPTWAAVHLLPDVVQFGTIGYLLGTLIRHRYRTSGDPPQVFPRNLRPDE